MTITDPAIIKRQHLQRAKYRADPMRQLWNNRKYRYGYTKEMCIEQVARQNGVCPVCRQSLSDIPPNKWHIDHCHKSGHVRGILCAQCNLSLGVIERKVQDSGGAWIQGAMEYLKKTGETGHYYI